MEPLIVIGSIFLSVYIILYWIEHKKLENWSVYFICPTCGRRHHAFMNRVYFMDEFMCHGCGTSKYKFERKVMRYKHRKWEEKVNTDVDIKGSAL